MEGKGLLGQLLPVHSRWWDQVCVGRGRWGAREGSKCGRMVESITGSGQKVRGVMGQGGATGVCHRQRLPHAMDQLGPAKEICCLSLL